MLTPREIHEMEFTRVFRGYEPEEVDAFVEKVVKGYEALYQENKELRERLKEKEEQLRKHEEQFVYTDEAIKLAKQAGEHLKEAAKKEADSIIQAARTKAEEIVAAAERETAAMKRRVAWLQHEESRFRQRLQQLFTEGLQMLEEIPAAAMEGLEATLSLDIDPEDIALAKEAAE